MKLKTGAIIVRVRTNPVPVMMTFRIYTSLSALLFLAACASTTKPAAPVAEDALQEPAAPVYVLSDIDGAKADAVDALLGPPALARREGDGEYRRYRLSECMLIIILYSDETGVRRAAHVEATALTSGREKPDLGACLAAG